MRLTRFLLFACLLTATTGLAAAPPGNDKDEPGFTPIFDGKTLTGWTGATTGYAAEDGEVTPGFASVAAAVLDHNGHPVAGIAVTWPVEDPPSSPDDVVATVRRTAGATSRRIGWPGP